MALLLVFMQLTRDLFEIAKFLLTVLWQVTRATDTASAGRMWPAGRMLCNPELIVCRHNMEYSEFSFWSTLMQLWQIEISGCRDFLLL